MASLRTYALPLLTLALAACGGGGGGDDAPAPPANSAPEFTGSAEISVVENSTAEIFIDVSDADGHAVRISGLAGADAAAFSANAQSLNFVSAPDFEVPADADGDNRYVLDVSISDGFGGVATRTYTISVTDTDDRGCAQLVQQELASCSAAVHSALDNCYGSTGEACAPGDAALNAPLQAMRDAVSQRCDNPAAAGFAVDVDALNAQLAESCMGRAETLLARSYGGPQAASLSAALTAGNTDQACLEAASTQGNAYAARVVSEYQSCIDAGNCASIDGSLQSAASAAAASIDQACTDNTLQSLNGLSAALLLQRTREDAECQVALGNPAADAVALQCAPKRSVRAVQAWDYGSGSANRLFASNTSDGSASSVTRYEPKRGEYVQIELDGNASGAVCGNGSNYRFWLQLAPEGHDLSNVVVYLQGGGACTLADCEPHILSAIEVANGGSGSSDRLLNTRHDNVGQNAGVSFADALEPNNPYLNWTKVSLMYCNQDIHAGGENGSQPFQVTVPGQGLTDYNLRRTGGHNVRAALAYARNAIWGAMAAESAPYDPSAVNFTLTGSSAGGFGTMYNYHYLLDELRWRNGAALNLWGQGIDDQGVAGSALRGLVAFLGDGWDLFNILPPYCNGPACVHAEEQVKRTMPRLDTSRYPRQHYGNVTAQIDITQAVTTGYGNDAAGLSNWGDALRDTYCRMRDANNIPSQDNQMFYLPLISAHGFNNNTAFAPNNISLYDWMADWEQDFVVADNVDASGNTIVANSETITLQNFSCLP